MTREIKARLKDQFMRATVKWVKEKVVARMFKLAWYWRVRWIVVLMPLWAVAPVQAQSFEVDVDYQLQRQYKGPLLKHEVFTNAAELAAYVDGGAQSRAYAGQIVVLVENGGEPVTYTLGGSGTNLVARETGRGPEDWTLAAYSAPGDFVVVTNSTGVTITDYIGTGGSVRIPPFIAGAPVTALAWGAFEAENELLHIEVPPTVLKLEQRAIYECGNLLSADLGGSVKVIGNSLFARCYSLVQVTGLESVTCIEPFGFHSTNIRQMHFGAGLTNIGNYAFYNCTNLQAVYFEGDAPTQVGDGVYMSSHAIVNYYRSGSSGFGDTWPSGAYAKATALFGPKPVASVNLFGVMRTPDVRGVLQITNVVRLVFATGDKLQGNGQNLFYINADESVTNQITANP